MMNYMRKEGKNDQEKYSVDFLAKAKPMDLSSDTTKVIYKCLDTSVQINITYEDSVKCEKEITIHRES